MDLLLNDVLHLTREEIENSKTNLICKLEVAANLSLIDGLSTRKRKKIIGTCKGCSYWGGTENRGISIQDNGYLVVEDEALAA